MFLVMMFNIFKEVKGQNMGKCKTLLKAHLSSPIKTILT